MCEWAGILALDSESTYIMFQSSVLYPLLSDHVPNGEQGP